MLRPWQIMQIATPVKFPRRPGTGSQQYSNQSSSFQLSVDLYFAPFIRRTDFQMVTDIKFAIMNLLIGSSEEHLSCFDCNKLKIQKPR